jgi:hypothetical protein
MTYLTAGAAGRRAEPNSMQRAELVERIDGIMAGCPSAVCPKSADMECERADLVPVVLTKPTPQELWLDFEVRSPVGIKFR